MKYFLFSLLFIPLALFSQKTDGYYFVFLNANPVKEILDSARGTFCLRSKK
jgi:hypothetical protein